MNNYEVGIALLGVQSDIHSQFAALMFLASLTALAQDNTSARNHRHRTKATLLGSPKWLCRPLRQHVLGGRPSLPWTN